MREELTVATADDMRALGRRLAAVLLPGDLVVLSGDLGAGKTTLVQGIGAGLGVRGPVTSPTFVIARVHPSLTGGPALVHADAYRLASPAEVDDLDLDASLETSVTVVEWGGGLVEGLAPTAWTSSSPSPLPAPAQGRGEFPPGTGRGRYPPRRCRERRPPRRCRERRPPRRCRERCPLRQCRGRSPPGPGRIRSHGRCGWRATAPGGTPPTLPLRRRAAR